MKGMDIPLPIRAWSIYLHENHTKSTKCMVNRRVPCILWNIDIGFLAVGYKICVGCGTFAK